MWTSLRIAGMGVLAQQQVLDVASSNLANASTVGYKRLRADVAVVPPDDSTFIQTQGGLATVDGQKVDAGRAVLDGIVTTTMRGPAMLTGNPLDILIAGDGFIEVSMGDGKRLFTRAGDLTVNADGQLVTRAGGFVQPPLDRPAPSEDLFILPDGAIMAGKSRGEAQLVGRIQLTRFVNPDGLERTGDNLLLATAASGEAVSGAPGTNGLGTLISGSLESSNVEVGDELVRILQAQRAYQLNLRALRTTDEMIQTANNLRR